VERVGFGRISQRVKKTEVERGKVVAGCNLPTEFFATSRFQQEISVFETFKPFSQKK